ncbi:MAG TPA: helix-turn-helix domain-containing protein [Aestuariivirgaceae bacterium]|nr:helix-turn-helix domain-containing protein [Aestuariivirgaceae bacterium]
MPRLSDPRRLPRRNHYQEGPGFLFLATQGGRPPQPSGAAERVATVVRRRPAALRRLEAGEAVVAICADIGCSRASLYRWRSRHARDGLAGLLDRPRRGRASSVPPVVSAWLSPSAC